jgi:periplasmic divalent cation tolerance protein
MPETTLIVFTTLPDAESAKALAAQLVQQELAACVNISGAITSVYCWQGEVHDDTEYQLAIKTTRARYDAAQAWIREHHPYELPEILAVPVARGLPEYLDWVEESCTSNS